MDNIVKTYAVINTESGEVVEAHSSRVDAVIAAAQRNDSEGGYKYKAEAR